MADSYRLQVLKAFTLLLEGITVAGGYNYTLGAGKVFRGRARFGEEAPIPMISILEAPRPGAAIYTGDNEARKDLWPLLLQGWCEDDKDNPSDPVYGLLDDVERRLDRVVQVTAGTGVPKFSEHYMLGGLITDLQVSPGVVRPPTENVSARSFFYLPVQVGLARIATS